MQVSKSGTKSWVLRYTKDKKVRYMGLGSALDWSLAEARERARKFRQLLDDDIDPLAHRDFERQQEVDLESKLWSIPKERMKAGRPHTVPLSDSAITVLKAAKLLQPKAKDANQKLTGMIFPGSTKGVLSDMTFTQIMRRMKVEHTMHGFRASFRTWAAEVAHYDHDLLEFALAHVVGDATVRAYQRSDMVEKRRKLMQDWAAYIRSTEGAELVQKPEEPKTREKDQRRKSQGIE